MTAAQEAAKRYAIFFPQFHRVRVNDMAWGEGFTDWTLVAAANAFNSWERRSPACGFYDLAKESDVDAQFETAASAGMDGFGIYHYRFDDGPELDAVERYLRRRRTPKGFKYFYIWANEPWSTRWLGENIEILKNLSSCPNRQQVAAHVNYLAPFITSDSYSHIQGRPLFVIYRPDWFQDAPATLSLYREEFARAGFEPSIGFFAKDVSDLRYSKMFDFCYLFEPRLFFNSYGLRKNRTAVDSYKRVAQCLSAKQIERLSEILSRLPGRQSRKGGSTRHFFSEFLGYFNGRERSALIRSSACPVQNVLSCGWNNAPRYRGRFTELEVPTAEQIAQTLAPARGTEGCSETIPLLCNAWNEWSEGAALEPCSYLGDTLLQAYLRRESIPATNAVDEELITK
jgi:Glycosyltransferase WbsX